MKYLAGGVFSIPETLFSHTNTMKPMNRMTRFLIYGLLGLFVEVAYTGLGSLINGDYSMPGNTYLVMVPVYGMAVLLEPVHDRIKGLSWWTRGSIYLILIWSIEYASGGVFDFLLGACPWHYTDPLNVNGYITLRMAPEWFVAGLAFERVRLFLDRAELRVGNIEKGR